MGAQWTDVVQTIASIAGVIVTLIGFGLVLFQIRQVERAQRGETNVALYAHMENVRAVFQNHPEIRPYFYENRDIDPRDPLYDLAISTAESMVDLFELVTFLRATVQTDSWETWKIYMRKLYELSPVLRLFVEQNDTWYTLGLLSIMRDGNTAQHKQQQLPTTTPK
jgi:hypothetical protein